MFKLTKRAVVATVAVAGAATLAAGIAVAVTGTADASTPAPNKICYNAGNGLVGAFNTCPVKYKTFTGAVGPRGATGAAGTAGKNGTNGVNGVNGTDGKNGTNGATGATGPSGTDGVVANSPVDLGAVASVATGGSFVSRATEVGTIHLDAGTYLVTMNAKATPPGGGTGTVDVFPQFFVYDQAVSSSFEGDLFNVGSGALESGSHANIDSYFSGEGEIAVPADGETLHVYAFGYDSDTGAGSYTLDDLTVTATQLQPAS